MTMEPNNELNINQLENVAGGVPEVFDFGDGTSMTRQELYDYNYGVQVEYGRRRAYATLSERLTAEGYPNVEQAIRCYDVHHEKMWQYLEYWEDNGGDI